MPLSGTTAQHVVSSPAGGLHAFKASYAGDAHNNPSASALLNTNVTNVQPPTLTMTGIANGASFATNSGSSYTGGAVNLQATAAAGNLLSRITLNVDGGTTNMPLNQLDYPTASWPLPALGVGQHTIAASALDNRGHMTSTSPVQFVVNAAGSGAPPTNVTITSPANGATFVSPAQVTLAISATLASPKTISSVAYYQGNSNLGSANSSPYTYTWSNVSPGTYSLQALVTDTGEAFAYSPPITITVTAPPPPPTVSITAPVSGASYAAPATIAIAANATPAAGGTITQVEFLNGSTVIGIATSPPYTFNWPNVAAGSYTLKARATDGWTSTTTSTGVPVTVAAPTTPPPPTVSITAPASGASFGTPATIAIAANATAAAGGTITLVEFLNGTTVIGTAATAPYTFSWPGVAAGSYTLMARATDSWTSTTTSAAIPVTVAVLPLSIAAAAGLDGSTVNDTTMVVNGTVVAPSNSGVTVNGILAALGTNGDFAVNEVPLTAGGNTITLTVTTQDGATASQTIAVNSSGVAAPFSVYVDPAEGVAPREISFRFRGGGSTPVATVELDADGNGTPDLIAAGMPESGMTATYASAGTFRPRITFKDASGAVLYTTSKQVHVINPLDKYNLVKGVYTDMVNRLQAGSTSTALDLFFGHARATYNDIFLKLGADLPAMADQLGAIHSISVSANVAELVIVRGVPGSQNSFMVYLMKGSDGIWRIESM